MQQLFIITMVAAALAVASSAAAQESTPAAGAPQAPSGLQLDLGQRLVTWNDNSDNEDGFRATFEITEASVVVHSETHTVPANVTSVQISEEGLAVAGDVYNVVVIAFNGAGDSPRSARLARSNEGGLILPTPTPAAADLPRTGALIAANGTVIAAVRLALLAGVTLLLLGVWIRAHAAQPRQ